MRSLRSRGPGPGYLSGVRIEREDRTAGIDEVIGDCALYENGQRRPGRVPFDRVAEVSTESDGFIWIGLQQPSSEDIAELAAELSLPALAVEDAVQAHQRPKLEIYDDVVFVVLKPVDYIDHDEVVEVSEIAIFLGPKWVVTVRHGHNMSLRQVRTELDKGDADFARFGPAGVLYRAADLVVDGYEEAIDSINTDIDEIEAQVFEGGDEYHGERIYKLKREVAEFRRAVQPLATPMYKLANGTVPGLDQALGPYFRDVHDHVLRTADAIDAHDRLLTDVLQADMSRLTLLQSQIAVQQNEVARRQNEDMRKISAWAAIALVPTAIAGVYGMNFENMPELRWEYGYFAVLGLMITTCIGLYIVFRRNGWL
jgi:magnesium transporter